MEGDPFAAPRLARDFYASNNGWASPLFCERPTEGKSDTFFSFNQFSLQQEPNLHVASDPYLNGQAPSIDAAINLHNKAAPCGLQFNHPQEKDTLQTEGASDPKERQASSPSPILAAPCGLQIDQTQDISLLREDITLKGGASDPFYGQAPIKAEIDLPSAIQACDPQNHGQVSLSLAASDHRRQAALFLVPVAATSSVTASPAAPSSLITHPAMLDTPSPCNSSSTSPPAPSSSEASVLAVKPPAETSFSMASQFQPSVAIPQLLRQESTSSAVPAPSPSVSLTCMPACMLPKASSSSSLATPACPSPESATLVHATIPSSSSAPAIPDFMNPRASSSNSSLLAAPATSVSSPAIPVLSSSSSTPPSLATSPSTLNKFSGWDDVSQPSSPLGWPDEVGLNSASSSTTIISSSLRQTRQFPHHWQSRSTNPLLSAVHESMPLQWLPGQPTTSSLLVGDIPLSPMLSSSPTSYHSLSVPALPLPGYARQSLAAPYPVDLLGGGQQPCCPLCGHTLPYTQSGPSTTSTFRFSPLRGRNVAVQARESDAAVSQTMAAARLSSRPRFKMKGEVKSFTIHKANLDPG